MKIGKLKVGRYPEADIFIEIKDGNRTKSTNLTDDQARKLIKELEKRLEKKGK